MLELRQIRLAFGNLEVLRGIDLTVEDGEMLALLGPSGSGKSTLLRVVAGLQRADAGTVLWNGQELAGVPPHRRNFGLMFQDYALFPHRSVGENVAFGLRMRRMDRREIEGRVREVLDWVGLSEFQHRAVTNLSGGEQQRVALARSLAPEPQLLMLDEPLGSLDRVLRERLALELRGLLSDPAITGLYVTHDQEEAFTVADRVAIMNEGRIVQAGRPADLWLRPQSEWVARFLGMRGLVEAEVAKGRALTPWGEFLLPQPSQNRPEGSRVTLILRPEALFLAGSAEEAATQKPSTLSGPVSKIQAPLLHLTGRVAALTFRDGHYRVMVQLERGPTLEVPLETQPGRRAPRDPQPGEGLRSTTALPQIGDSVRVGVRPELLTALGD
ncbi:MAG TPA: ABC transporter ATP-binding protein [Thermoleophilia bacterium]|nr:ABC transporter ATP-binding protein [Thermoleophilia bacterium]